VDTTQGNYRVPCSRVCLGISVTAGGVLCVHLLYGRVLRQRFGVLPTFPSGKSDQYPLISLSMTGWETRLNSCQVAELSGSFLSAFCTIFMEGVMWSRSFSWLYGDMVIRGGSSSWVVSYHMQLGAATGQLAVKASGLRLPRPHMISIAKRPAAPSTGMFAHEFG
jgi:hypothetical protein